MDFDLTDEHLIVKESAREFAQAHLFPGVIERDIQAAFPKELTNMMGEMGFMGMMTLPEYGEGEWTPFHTCWPWRKFPKSMRPPV